MGLGKTLLALYEFWKLYDQELVDTMMIFCPNSLISVWKTEIKKHGFIFDVQVKPDFWVSDGKNPTVVIYNYESIIATAGRLIPIIVNQSRTYAVFDESVQIKNFRSQRWKNIRTWEGKLSYVRLLSGRPMVQSPMDLWTQLTILEGKVSSSPFAFRNTYCVMGGWQNKEVVATKNLDQLRDITKKVSFVATKKEWLDLPPKLYTSREYEMTLDQRKAYAAMFKHMVLQFKSGKIISVEQAVHKYSKLQQIGSGFAIDTPTGDAYPLMPFREVPKVKVLMDIVEELKDESKLIIFAHYVESVNALEKLLGWPTLRGGMKSDEIQEVKDRFNEDDSVGGIISQLTAGKYGHTLLGSLKVPCHTTFYFENTYALDPRIQSEDRNHRHGQHNAVLYIDTFGTPIERKIMRALQGKDDVSRVVLDMVEEDSGWHAKKLQTLEPTSSTRQ